MFQFNPLYVKGIAALLLVAALFFLHHHIDQVGYDRAKLECQAENDKATFSASKKMAEANEDVRVKQAHLNAIQGALDKKGIELHDEQIKVTKLESDRRSGAQRLSVIIASNANCGAKQSGGSSAASVDNGTEVIAELDKESAANITRQATIGDSAITRLNGCIAAYDSVMSAVNR